MALDVNFRLQTYFSHSEVASYYKLTPSLQKSFLWRFLQSNDHLTIKIAKVALDIINRCQNLQDSEKVFKIFFQESNEDLEILFDQLQQIASVGYLSTFFAFSTSKKKEYNNVALKEITQLFLQACNQQCASSYLTSLPKHEEGGKEKLQKLLLSQIEQSAQKTFSLNFANYSFSNIEKKELQSMLNSLFTESTPNKSDLLLSSISEFKILFGKELFLILIKRLQQENSFPQLLRVFQLLNQLTVQEELLWEKLDQFLEATLSFTEFLDYLESLHSQSNRKVKVSDIQNLKNRFQLDPNVLFPLDKEAINLIFEQYAQIQDLCEQYKAWNLHQLVQRAIEVSGQHDQNKLLELVAIGKISIHHHFSHELHSTQVLTILGLLQSHKSCIAQVKTGEGKSYIVALLTFVQAIQGRAVDIISSARSLAVRDQARFATFFKEFDLTSSHICVENRVSKNFEAQILYGTVADFEWSWMEEKLWGKKLFTARIGCNIKSNFDCVLVDEVDNLLIDTASNSARISYPSEQSYHWVYAPILSFVKEGKSKDLREHLLEHVPPQFQTFIPLLEEGQLISWLEAAKIALNERTEGVDYIVKQEKSLWTGKLENSIKIVDAENTGNILDGCRWSAGIHEFVEAKHNIAVQQESLTPLSLSHAVFYSFYRTIFGLSGTIGSIEERKEIRSIYNISSFDVPSFLPSQRVDLSPIVVDTDEEYFNKIVEAVKMCQKKRRPILVLCKTIQDSEKLYKLLKKKKITSQLFNEMQEAEGEEIIAKGGLPTAITIATNTGGRGVDIRLSEESLINGGLFLLLTFYPESKRVHEQAIGRAGRQGQPGTSQVIFKMEETLKFLHSKVVMMISQNPIAALDFERELYAQQRSGQHQLRARLERYYFPLVDTFFNTFAKWGNEVSAATYLTHHSERLSSMRLLESCEIDLEHLHPNERSIAETCLHLLSRNQIKGINPSLNWKLVLQKLIERTKTKILNNWCLCFHHPLDLIVQEGQMECDFEKIKKTIEKLHEQNRVSWEKYLIPSGIFKLLEEIIQIDLSES